MDTVVKMEKCYLLGCGERLTLKKLWLWASNSTKQLKIIFDLYISLSECKYVSRNKRHKTELIVSEVDIIDMLAERFNESYGYLLLAWDS